MCRGTVAPRNRVPMAEHHEERVRSSCFWGGELGGGDSMASCMLRSSPATTTRLRPRTRSERDGAQRTLEEAGVMRRRGEHNGVGPY